MLEELEGLLNSQFPDMRTITGNDCDSGDIFGEDCKYNIGNSKYVSLLCHNGLTADLVYSDGIVASGYIDFKVAFMGTLLQYNDLRAYLGGLTYSYTEPLGLGSVTYKTLFIFESEKRITSTNKSLVKREISYKVNITVA